jgi:hypothetical protein
MKQTHVTKLYHFAKPKSLESMAISSTHFVYFTAVELIESVKAKPEAVQSAQ